MAPSSSPPAFTPEESQHFSMGYAFSYFFHPVKAVAREMTIEAWDYRLVLDATQEKRRWWSGKRRTKTQLTRAGLFLQALCAVSDRWERDQERAVSWRAANTYRPGADDRLIRYVKFLLWRTMEYGPAYRALALGCLLYSYAPNEVAQFTMEAWDSTNFRRLKKTLLDWVTTRFPVQTETVPPRQETKLVGRAPTKPENELIMATLRLFTAWWQFMPRRAHPVGTPHTPLNHLFRDVTSFLQSLADDQRHALACEVCGGIPQLVQQYNTIARPPLGDPDAMLRVPLWCDAASGGQEPPDASAFPPPRHTPPPLDAGDWQAIEAALADKQLRRNAYQGGILRICVDGQEQQHMQTAQTTTAVTLDIAAEAASLEVYGGEPPDDVLLAVVPLGHGAAAAPRRPQRWTVTHAGGQRLTLQVTTRHADEPHGYQVHLTYTQRPPRPAYVAVFVQQVQHWWGRLAFAHAPRWSPVLVGLLLLSLGGNLWLSSRALERPTTARLDVTHPRSGEPATPVVLFNTAQFQRALPRATDLEALATAQAVPDDQSYILGLAAPTPRAAFVRLGRHYAHLLAALHSARPERAALQLDRLIQTLRTVPAPPVLGQYLQTLRTALDSPQASSQDVALLAGLFEPLYAEVYGVDGGHEALTLFRAGAWLLNVAMAAAAGETAALRQGPAAATLAAALSQLQAPPAIPALFTRLHDLMARQAMTAQDIAEIQEIVHTLQRRLST